MHKTNRTHSVALISIALSILFLYAFSSSAQLSDSETDTLERYDKAQKNFQPTAIRALKESVRNLKSQIRDIKRDDKLSRSERDRRSEELEAVIKSDEEFIEKITKGEADAYPEIDFSKAKPGDIGWIGMKDFAPLLGYYYEFGEYIQTDGSRRPYSVIRDASGRKVAYPYFKGIGQDYGKEFKQGGKYTFAIFELVEIKENKGDVPTMTFRYINVEDLRERSATENAKPDKEKE